MSPTTHHAPAGAIPLDDPLVVGGHELSSRLFLGTGGSRRIADLEAAVLAAEPSLVTVAMRRISTTGKDDTLGLLRRLNTDLRDAFEYAPKSTRVDSPDEGPDTSSTPVRAAAAWAGVA